VNGSYLLDTNIVVALIAGEPAVVQHTEQASRVYLPSIVIGELFYGAHRSGRVAENIDRLERFVASRVILACDASTARHYGQIKQSLRVKGRPIPENDIWIAAIARQFNVTLVSRDGHFFDIDGIAVERW
jgi:tRNA(fMet)-specific endonuclease VapC